MKRLLITLLCGCVLLAQPPRKPVFISPGLMNAVVYITPPPAANSAVMARDLGEIYALHHLAKPEQLAAANDDNEHEDIFAIGRVLGSKFTKEQMPLTASFWTDVNNDLSIFVTAAKQHFQELRPYDFDPIGLKSLCGSKPGGPRGSFPSGHGSVGYASAMLLSRMVPEKAAELRDRAEEYAHNRVVCGDHYAQDLKGSKEASEIVLGNMAGQAKFEKEFAAAKAEVRRILGL